ncbi:MAG TPA: 50S ribosomal protein L30 [Candidatus Limnocylindrales bacterium]|nr:50S ribosomal protein L30 [Candidatus Limnocylindrales bacterium]
MPAKLRVTLVKSPISHTQRTRATMRALGLHRIGETVEVADTPELRGMARAIRFLVRTETVEETAAPAAAPRKAADKAAATKPARTKKEVSKS